MDELDITNIGESDLHDVAIKNLVVELTTTETLDTLHVRFDISNLGDADLASGAFGYSADLVSTQNGSSISAQLDNYYPVPDLAAGDTESVAWNIPIGLAARAMAPGTYEVRITLDHMDELSETDESNNVAELMVIGAPPPATVPAGTHSDFDGDGFDDILFFNAESNSVGQIGSATGVWSGIAGVGEGWELVGIGRFDDDDNAADLLWYNETTRGLGRIDISGGSDKSWDVITKVAEGWEVAATGDFNGDDVDDILFLNATTSAIGFFDLSSGSPVWNGLGMGGAGWAIVGVGDFNDDGSDDVLWQHETSGALGQHMTGGGGSPTTWAGIEGLPAGFTVVGTGQFDVATNGTDILAMNEATGEVGYLDNDARAGVFDWVELGTMDAGWAVAGVGDYNADGTDDILWQHEDGRLGQYRMDAGTYEWIDMGSAGEGWDVLL